MFETPQDAKYKGTKIKDMTDDELIKAYKEAQFWAKEDTETRDHSGKANQNDPDEQVFQKRVAHDFAEINPLKAEMDERGLESPTMEEIANQKK